MHGITHGIVINFYISDPVSEVTCGRVFAEHVMPRVIHDALSIMIMHIFCVVSNVKLSGFMDHWYYALDIVKSVL